MYPVPIIPDDWSPEQAIAVYEFLDEVRERVWDRYQDHIIEQFRINCHEKKFAQPLTTGRERHSCRRKMGHCR